MMTLSLVRKFNTILIMIVLLVCCPATERDIILAKELLEKRLHEIKQLEQSLADVHHDTSMSFIFYCFTQPKMLDKRESENLSLRETFLSLSKQLSANEGTIKQLLKQGEGIYIYILMTGAFILISFIDSMPEVAQDATKALPGKINFNFKA